MTHSLLTFALLLCITPFTNVFAAVHDVNQNDNIVNKLTAASSGDTIRFAPGTYEINIVLGDKNLKLTGIDTKNTILKSKDGTNPTIEISGASNTTIQNFTFLEADVGILIDGSSSRLIISNNVFRLGVDNTALEISNGASGEIINNTFYGNSINISSLSNFIDIKNNIFADFNTLFAFGSFPPNIISFNCIETSDTDFNLPINNKIDAQPSFVNTDIDTNDFHLEADSDCIDLPEVTGDYDAAGAYGGDDFDKAPDLAEISSINKDDVTAVIVLWSASKDHQVDGYKLYYHTDPIYTNTLDSYLTLDDRNSILNVVDTGTALSHTINDLNTQSQQTSAPVLSRVLPGRNKLSLTWSAVENATSYVVHHKTEDDTAMTLDVGNVNSYEITGLSNNLVYTVWLQAKNQVSYYFQVATYIDKSEDDDADKLTESYFTRDDEKSDIGEPVLSEISNQISMQPEAIVAYPVLPNEGCFIATAAFGFYAAEDVQVLREFRDNYLLTNDAGRTFVKGYYHYGPYAASIINEYPLLKPVTRALLYPLILTAKLLEQTIIGFFVLLGICLILITTYPGFARKIRRVNL